MVSSREAFLINRVLSGKPLPMGTSIYEQRAVERFLEANPEAKKQVERVSTQEILRTQNIQVDKLTKENIKDLTRLGAIRQEKVLVSPEVSPTATERALRMSLPANLRDRPVQEVLRLQGRTTPEASLREKINVGLGVAAKKVVGFIQKVDEKGDELTTKLFGPSKQRDLQAERDKLREDFPPLKIFDVAAEGVVRTAEFVGGDIKGPAREQTKEVISDIFTIGAFSPLMSTGTAATKTKSKQILKEKKKPIVKKKAPTKEQLEGYFREAKGKSFSAQSQKAKDLLKFAKNPEQRKAIRDILRQEYGAKWLADFEAQEGAILRGLTAEEIAALKSAPINTFEFDVAEIVAARTIPVLRSTSPFIVGESLIQPSEVGTLAKPKSAQDVFLGTASILNVKSDIAQKTGQESATAQESLTIQQPKTAQITTPRLLTQTAFKPRQLRPISSILGFEQPIPKKPKIKLPELESGSRKRIQQVKRVMKEMGFIPQVLERGKWKSVSRKPLSKKDALALAGNVVDNSLSAQLRILKSKKPASRKLNRIIDESKFRNYKLINGKRQTLDSFGRIELKKFRLDTPSEKKQISAAKYLKSQEFKKFLSPLKKPVSSSKRRRRKKKIKFI